jgi:hypothetical protein
VQYEGSNTPWGIASTLLRCRSLGERLAILDRAISSGQYYVRQEFYDFLRRLLTVGAGLGDWEAAGTKGVNGGLLFDDPSGAADQQWNDRTFEFDTVHGDRGKSNRRTK